MTRGDRQMAIKPESAVFLDGCKGYTLPTRIKE
jgi:hypothetical protein